MAERKQKSTEVEVADPVVQAVEDLPEEVKEDNSNPELAEFVKSLVENFASQAFAELEQRVRDLETLVGQPEGAVQFTTPPPSPEYKPAPDGGVPWYQASN